jgi:glucokinase
MKEELAMAATREGMSRDCVVAVDVGGSVIKAALIDNSGVRHAARRIPTGGSDGQEAVMTRIEHLIESLRAEARLHGIEPVATGVVVPGLVDEENGTVIASANLGWQQVPMLSLLQGRSELPVVVGHDVRAAGLAEAAWGAARGKADVVFVAIGTGIAAALTVASRPYSGGGFAGELGHLPIAGQAQPCGCGGTGCLETAASAAAIASRFNQATGSSSQLSAIEVAGLAAQGNKTAARIWGEAIDALGYALTVCVRLIAPEIIVIGGGLAEAGDQLLHPLRENVDGALQFKRPVEIRTTELADMAGCAGAGLMGWQIAGKPAVAAS